MRRPRVTTFLETVTFLVRDISQSDNLLSSCSRTSESLSGHGLLRDGYVLGSPSLSVRKMDNLFHANHSRVTTSFDLTMSSVHDLFARDGLKSRSLSVISSPGHHPHVFDRFTVLGECRFRRTPYPKHHRYNPLPCTISQRLTPETRRVPEK